jgi:hypothetical protein
MGKRKIGEIYNKPIVEGDKNLVTNNEIHKSELSGGSGSGSGIRNVEYLDLTTDPNSLVILELMGAFVTSVRVNFMGRELVSGGIIVGLQGEEALNNLKAICIDKDLKFTSFTNDLITLYTYETFTKNFTPEVWDIYNSIPRMTEEEFYKIN